MATHFLKITVLIGKYLFQNMCVCVANGQGDQGSVPGRILPKTQKMVLDTFLPNTQHYKVRIKGKLE